MDCRNTDGSSPLYVACDKVRPTAEKTIDKKSQQLKIRVFVVGPHGHCEDARHQEQREPVVCRGTNASVLGRQGRLCRHCQVLVVSGSLGKRTHQKTNSTISRRTFPTLTLKKVTTNEGATPLYIACHNGHVDIVKQLADHGGDLEKRFKHYGPLYVAAEKVTRDFLRRRFIAALGSRASVFLLAGTRGGSYGARRSWKYATT